MLSFIAVMYVKMNFQRNCHVVLFGLLDVIEKGEICSKRPPGANGAALLDKNRAHNGQRGEITSFEPGQECHWLSYLIYSSKANLFRREHTEEQESIV